MPPPGFGRLPPGVTPQMLAQQGPPPGPPPLIIAQPQSEWQIIAWIAAQLTVYDEPQKNVELAARLCAEAWFAVESGRFKEMIDEKKRLIRLIQEQSRDRAFDERPRDE